MAGVFNMVDSKDRDSLDKYLQALAEQLELLEKENNIQTEQPLKRDVVLFFSYDIVNSTAYKSVNYFGWAQVLNLLFKALREDVQNQIKGAEMWRVLGDEAIFIVKIRDDDELHKYIRQIYKIMISTISKLKNGEFFKTDDNFNLMKLQNILSLKTAAWIAAVSNVGDISKKVINLEEVENIFERYRSQEGYEFFEFLGNDIDTGFRVATQVQDGRMVLSYELAYLVSQKTEGLSNLHIITYKRLKGVWKEKLYPVIWYHDPKAYFEYYQKEIAFEESFIFDDCVESDLIKEYYNNRAAHAAGKEILDDKMYTEPYYALNKILRDRDLVVKIENLQKLIKEATYDQTRYIDMEKLQLHCVAVCFKIDQDGVIKILIAKRQENRAKLGGKWEFGCAKAVLDKSIVEKIKEEYKQDFDIQIEPILDNSREMKEPIPLALYHINRDNEDSKMDKGIITLAEIVGDYDIRSFKATIKHEKVQWITESDLKSVEKDLEYMIPDFKRTLMQSFEKIKELKTI